MFDFVYDIINEAVDEGRFVDIGGIVEELTRVIYYATKKLVKVAETTNEKKKMRKSKAETFFAAK